MEKKTTNSKTTKKQRDFLDKTYIDNGYLRYKDSNELIHRWVAKKEFYLKDRKKYPLDWNEYIVHHEDGDKLNNKPENLKILLKKEHEKVHGVRKNNFLMRNLWWIILIAIILVGLILSLTLFNSNVEKDIDCSSNRYDCSDFSNCFEVMQVFGQCDNDPNFLDGDDDGRPCESLCS